MPGCPWGVSEGKANADPACVLMFAPLPADGAGKFIWTRLVPPKNCVAWRETILLIRPSRNLSLRLLSSAGVADSTETSFRVSSGTNGCPVVAISTGMSSVNVSAAILRVLPVSEDDAGSSRPASIARLVMSSAAASLWMNVSIESVRVSRLLTCVWDAGLDAYQYDHNRKPCKSITCPKLMVYVWRAPTCVDLRQGINTLHNCLHIENTAPCDHI
jgi:hypothetical protein